MIERGPDRDALSLIAGYGEQGDVAAPAMGLRRMVVLAWRTWPYMRPMLVHLVGLVAVMLAGGLTGLVGAFVGVDLFANKVLVGEKLQPHQATVLFVGEDYVTTDPQSLGNGEGAVAGEEDARGTEPELTPEQRRTVRNRLVVWGVAGGVFAAVVAFVFWYYSTWVWQCVNQNLRVAMIERAEALSLRYHDSNRVGDAIFRVYQDSAMIVNLIQSAVFSPLTTLYGVLTGVVIVAAFDPWFAVLVLLVGIPTGRCAGPTRTSARPGPRRPTPWRNP